MQARGFYRPDGADAVWRGCCTFVLHMASSSRSQVAVPTGSGAARLTWEPPSVNVRWRPLLVMAIVTHLVTRSLASLSDERLLRRPYRAWTWQAGFLLGAMVD